MRNSSSRIVPVVLLAGWLPAAAQTAAPDLASRAGLPLEQTASRGIVTRDPSTIVKCGDEFWVFYTGRGIPSYRSKDLVKWEPGPPVFRSAPEWVATVVPENRNMNFWAPDIIHLGDRYLLYYSVSAGGLPHSAIGVASTRTLDPADPAYGWTDHGVVVQSEKSKNVNAIDPSLFSDDDGTLWMAFGSFAGGIRLVQLDPKTGKLLKADAPWLQVASYYQVEAVSLYKREGYYYLFVNFDNCCRGVNSSYSIRVGRSRKITGPYVDKDGVELLKDGGSIVIPTKNGPLIGPGHAGILIDRGKSWFTSDFEGDTRMGGRATLAIMPLTWKDGWPEVEVVDR